MKLSKGGVPVREPCVCWHFFEPPSLTGLEGQKRGLTRGKDNIFSIYISFFVVRQMFWPPCLLIYKEFHRPAAGERGQRAAHMSSVALRSKVGGWCSLLFTIFYPDSVLQHFLWVFGPASLGHVKKKKEYIYKVLFYLPVLLPCFFALTFVPFVCFFEIKNLVRLLHYPFPFLRVFHCFKLFMPA